MITSQVLTRTPSGLPQPWEPGEVYGVATGSQLDEVSHALSSSLNHPGISRSTSYQSYSKSTYSNGLGLRKSATERIDLRRLASQERSKLSPASSFDGLKFKHVQKSPSSLNLSGYVSPGVKGSLEIGQESRSTSEKLGSQVLTKSKAKLSRTSSYGGFAAASAEVLVGRSDVSGCIKLEVGVSRDGTSVSAGLKLTSSGTASVFSSVGNSEVETPLRLPQSMSQNSLNDWWTSAGAHLEVEPIDELMGDSGW